MKILLAGHEGYVGTALQKVFQSQSHEVIGYGRKQDLLSLRPSFLEKNEIGLVVNCATAMDRVGTRYVLGCADEQVNVMGTRNLVDALKDSSIPLVHISTKDVYGSVYSKRDVDEKATRFEPRFEIDDEQPFSPKTVYAKTKLMGEFIAESHPRTNIVRLTSCYTSESHRRGNWVVGFCRSVRDEKKVQISGNGKQLRDLLHANDLGALILKMAESGRWGYSLNAGGGYSNAHSIVEVLDMIDPKAEREFTPGGDYGFVSSNRIAKEVFEWTPKILFQEQVRIINSNIRKELQ
jgi:CDP-paratose 2-epimerase